MLALKSYRIQLSSASCNYKIELFSQNAFYAMYGGRGFCGFALIASGKIQILATVPHLQV